MNNFGTYLEVITTLESMGADEAQILNVLEKELTHKGDINSYYDANDALRTLGYQTFFDISKKPKRKFIADEYEELIKHVKKYKFKTDNLMSYLNDIGFFNLSILASDFILAKHLPELCLFMENIKENFSKEMTLYNVYFENYNNDEIRNYIEKNVFDKIGIKDIDLDYTRFHFDLEYLLWNITKTDNSIKAYYKVNTIKVGLNIIDSNFVVLNGKPYYDLRIQKKLTKYISLIPKELRLWVINKYSKKTHLLYDDGYKLFFNLL